MDGAALATTVPTVARQLLAARLVVLVTFLDLFIQFPVVAPYAQQLGADSRWVGLIVGVYSATNLVGNIVAGVWLDRWGRRGPILLGLLVSALALAGYALARLPEHLVVARAIHGLATAVLTPGAFAMLGDHSVDERRARVMGVSGALIAVTAVIGPPLAGITRDRLGAEVVFVGGAVLMLLVAVAFGVLARGDGLGLGGMTVAAPSPGRQWWWREPRLLAACLAALALTVGLGTLVTYLPLALAGRLETGARTGQYFGIYALVALVAMATPVNRLSERWGRHRPVAVGLALIGFGLSLIGGWTTPAGVAAGMACYGLGFGILFPAATALVAAAGGRAGRGVAFGIFYAVYSLGVVLGSLLSGEIGQAAGLASGLPFVVSAVVALVIAPLVLALGRRARPVASA